MPLLLYVLSLPAFYLYLNRLDPDRPQWDTLWHHSLLLTRGHGHLGKGQTGGLGATGRGQVLPHSGAGGAVPEQLAGHCQHCQEQHCTCVHVHACVLSPNHSYKDPKVMPGCRQANRNTKG